MLHALRSSPSRLREDREAGFTLIEILVAMVLMAIVMSSLAVFFIGAQKSSSALRTRQNATVIADQAMDHVHGLPVSKLVINRDFTSEHAQWQSLGVSVFGVDKNQTVETWDTDPAVTAGTGATYVMSGTQRVYTAGLPTVPVPQVVNKTTYTVSYIMGECYLPGSGGGGDCLKAPLPAWLNPVKMDRVIVAVNWPDKGTSCPFKTCAYVIASLISPSGDPTFNVHQVLVDTTPPSTPTLAANPGACAASSNLYKDVAITLAAWSPSTDASGVAKYDIWRGKNDSNFGHMIKITSQPTTAAYIDNVGLDPDTVYYYAVVAVDTVGNTSAPQVAPGTVTSPQQPFMATCSTAPDTFVPTPPGTPVASAPTSSSLTVSWALGNDEYKVGGYQLFRSGTPTPIATTSASTLTFVDNGLAPWTNYTYYVKTVDKFGNVSGPSGTSAPVRTTDTVPPSVPTALSAVAKPSPALEIDLDWTDSSDDVAVTGYTVWRSTTGTGGWTALAGPTTSSLADTSVLANMTYYYYVTAHDAVPLTSGASVVAFALTPDTQAPSTPVLANSGKTDITVSLSWPAATDNRGVVSYAIYRGGVQVGTTSSLTYTDNGLAPNTPYTYTVQAYDPSGNNSTASNSVAVTTSPDTTKPAMVTGVIGTYLSPNSARISWNVGSDDVAVAKYQIYVAGTGLSQTILSPTLSYTYGSAFFGNGTTKQLTVYALDAAGNTSAVSATLTCSTNGSGGVTCS